MSKLKFFPFDFFLSNFRKLHFKRKFIFERILFQALVPIRYGVFFLFILFCVIIKNILHHSSAEQFKFDVFILLMCHVHFQSHSNLYEIVLRKPYFSFSFNKFEKYLVLTNSFGQIIWTSFSHLAWIKAAILWIPICYSRSLLVCAFHRIVQFISCIRFLAFADNKSTRDRKRAKKNHV